MSLLFVCVVLTIMLFVCAKKFGREKTLSFAIKVMSPIFIILFHLSGFSIIVPIFAEFNIIDSIANTNNSIRVAIDSSIVTLFVNTILVLLNSPIKVEVNSKDRLDLDQVITYCNRSVKVDYRIKVNFRYKWVKKFYRKYRSPTLQIINSKNTSIAVDKSEEYTDIINFDNISQYISINLANISNSDDVENNLYFTLAIQSNKSVKWDDAICTKVLINQRSINGIHKLIWQANEGKLKLVHREEVV